MFLLLSTALALCALIVGTITDLRTREVPDWVNYGLLSAALALRIVMSIADGTWQYLAEGFMGFAAMVAFAYILFYTGQVGGGDAKLLIAMGMVLGLPWSWYGGVNSMLIAFVMNSLIAGGLYGLCWSMVLTARNWRRMRKAFATQFSDPKLRTVRRWGLVGSALLLLAAFAFGPILVQVTAAAIVVLYLIALYAYVFTRAVEGVCMRKQLPVGKLTVGDWIPENVVIGGKVIVGPRDLGISAEQIATLQKLAKQRKLKTVLVKEGVPFVPSFLLAYGATLLWGNVLFTLVA